MEKLCSVKLVPDAEKAGDSYSSGNQTTCLHHLLLAVCPRASHWVSVSSSVSEINPSTHLIGLLGGYIIIDHCRLTAENTT